MLTNEVAKYACEIKTRKEFKRVQINLRVLFGFLLKSMVFKSFVGLQQALFPPKGRFIFLILTLFSVIFTRT